MGDCWMLPSVSKIIPACAHKQHFANRFLYTMKKLTLHHMHHVLKCFICQKAILVITG